MFLGWFTAEPEPSLGYVPATYPAYLVQVLARPGKGYACQNISGRVTASAPIPVPSASAPGPSSTCLFVGWYGANGMRRHFADCAGLLVDPPATLTLRVGPGQ